MSVHNEELSELSGLLQDQNQFEGGSIDIPPELLYLKSNKENRKTPSIADTMRRYFKCKAYVMWFSMLVHVVKRYGLKRRQMASIY